MDDTEDPPIVLNLDTVISDNVWKGRVQLIKGGTSAIIAKKVTLNVSSFKDFINSMRELNKDVSRNNSGNLCPFYCPMEVDGVLYVLRPWKERTLKDEMMKGKGMELETIIRCAIDIARAINDLHLVDRVSFSLKPENILLAENKRNKILLSDYSLHSIFKSFQLPLQLDIRSTYSAPETWTRFNENEPIDPSADCWSFGCLLLEMCSGCFIWEGLKTNEIEEFVKSRQLPIRLDSVLEGPLLEIVTKCLDYQHDRRPSFNELMKMILSNKPPMTLHKHPSIIKTRETVEYVMTCLEKKIQNDDMNDFGTLLCKLPIPSKDIDQLVLSACNSRSLQCLKVLLESGEAKFDVEDGSGKHVLFITMEKGFNDCSLTMLRHWGAKLLLIKSENKMPIYRCAELNCPCLLEQLFASAGEVPPQDLKEIINTAGPAGTPLCVAVEKGHVAIVKASD